MKTNIYQVANHRFQLSACSNIVSQLHSYEPFRVSDSNTARYRFHLSLVEQVDEQSNGDLIGSFNDDIAHITVAKHNDGTRFFTIAYPDSEASCKLQLSADLSTATASLHGSSFMQQFGLNNALMLLYALTTAPFGTLMVHASVVKNSGNGYLFLGKSGTGKSTHSRLWLEHVAGSELLNDDNPIIQISDGKAQVFGSPWSGKTPCYRNESVPIKGIVRLHQAPQNSIAKLSPIQAYAALLPSCSNMKWEQTMAEGVHHTVEQLATTVPFYRLSCLPNKAAAELCFTSLNK